MAIKNASIDETLGVADEGVAIIVYDRMFEDTISIVDFVGPFNNVPAFLREDLEVVEEWDEIKIGYGEVLEYLALDTDPPDNGFLNTGDFSEAIEELLDSEDELVAIIILNDEIAEAMGIADEGVSAIVLNDAIEEALAAADEYPQKGSATGNLGGLYRIENETLDRWELYLGVGVLPDLTDDPVNNPPYATYAGPPFIVNLPPGATYYLVFRKRNVNGLLEENFQVECISIGPLGELLQGPPTKPHWADIKGIAGGDVHISALYNAIQDENAADQWQIYLTDDGSDPDDPGALVGTIDMDDQPVKFLRYDTSTGWIHGTLIRSVVKAYRSADGVVSETSDELSHTIDTEGPTIEAGEIILGGGADA